MPYTPPARSPASSAPSTPDVSRRPSIQSDNASAAASIRPALPRSNSSAASSRPSLPRSSSYAQRSRRSPSASGATSPAILSPSHELKIVIGGDSVRQSPPPVTDGQAMPSGAIISPPESSDDESGLGVRSRLPGVQVKELQQAISQIPQQRAGSPERAAHVPSPLVFRDISDVPPQQVMSANPHRKNGHKRSVTEPNASAMMLNESSVSTEEEDSDAELRIKPQMVRKKSGELVRPALRAPSHRRPSSMPGTPTYKAVHFDSHLEHVRHFLQVDRPTAVSASSSPADHYDSDTEYPFPGSDDRHKMRQPPFEWELNARNFPAGDSPVRWAQPVRLEKVWLSPSDQKSLIGSIVVANLAFNKAVQCRFTFDYWKTTSELAAEYSSPVVPKMTPEGHDRFTFSIKLSDTANLESKTLYMCIRYSVNGTEHWDNNNGANFQIDFRKKHLPQNGKGNFQGALARPVAASSSNALPRSNRRTNSSSGAPPRSKASTAASAASSSSPAAPKVTGFAMPEQSRPLLHEVLGEPGPVLRFKAKSMVSLPSDNLSNGLSAPSGQAFAGRYDFGVSLRAAKDGDKDRSEDGGLYMKSSRREAPAAARPAISFAMPAPTAAAAAAPRQSPAPIPPMGTRAPATLPPVPGTGSPVVAAGAGSPLPGGSASPSSLLANDSYDELVNKYCFFVPKQSGSPAVRDGPFRGAPSFDGGAAGARAAAYAGNPGPQQQQQPGDARDAASYFGSSYTLRNSPLSSPAPGSPGRAGGAGARQQSVNAASSSPRTSAAAMGAPAGAGVPLRSASPASFASFAGASPTEEYAFHLQERYPFTADAHAATAIRSG
jgi:hypothetical protein